MSYEGKDRRQSPSLDSIEVQIAVLTSEVRNSHKIFMDFEKEIHDWRVDIKKTLYGNGEPGLIKDVDRLKNTQRGWSDSLKVIWVAVVGLMFKVVYDVFKNS